MKYSIQLHTNFRPDRFTLLHPGVYRVPEDMSEELAGRALEDGAQKLAVKAKGAAPENKGNRRGSVSNNASDL